LLGLLGLTWVNKADKERYHKLADLGCIVCLHNGIYTPPAIHHTDGRTKPGANKKTIGLCGAHHQTGGEGVAFHATGRKTWEAKYGKEADLLAETNRLINA